MTDAPDPGSQGGHGGHWFEGLADHTGEAYLRYSFTKGTEQEVAFLFDVLGLGPGSRVLDVGCGPGRHAHALAARGIAVHGIDISQRFVDLAVEHAPPGATFERLDARALAFDGEFDAAISLCQGAFGLLGRTAADAAPDLGLGRAGRAAPTAGRTDHGTSEATPSPIATDPDGAVLAGMARAVKPGTGLVAVSAFSAYFQVRWLDDPASFDADAGVNHERTTVKDPAGADADFDLWTTCFTPRELRLLAAAAGLEPRHLWSVTPGDYARRAPTIDTPEFLLVAARP